MPPTEATRIVFPQIRRAEWERVPLPSPEQLGPTEVLVRAACTLVSAGTELAIYSGAHIGYTIPGARYPRLPFHPGYAFAGTIEATGSAATGLRPGDRVRGSLLHQDWAVADTSRHRLGRLPDDVSFEQGCLARLASISMQGVRLAQVRLGDRVAVFGQGLIGQFARQLAALDGAAVTVAVDLFDVRLELARRHGATHAINPARDDVAASIAAATDGQGVDVAIEATGHPPVINDALRAAATLGRVVLLGSPRGRVEIDPYSDIHRKGVSLIGAHAGTAAGAPNAYHRWTTGEHERIAVELMRQGRLHTDGIISHRIPASQALGIFDALVDRPQDHLGVVINWS
ncbi:MAG: zinc-binding alcohol dehydrogenase [Chloroflexi bacterium]|nr:zinc-binding alcohol dehydrogenase [Chloroflexota bacterium]